ncbi:MAG: hypothetical protein QNJ46_18145 [Leptolyngbyaceae cyanobacterium MO_188.B28]|nr:hypothetical protein [Leptolyngbyaceae cyanobacterium MO_188.B28]
MNHHPKIVSLDMLDTDYAKLVAGETIPEYHKHRLGQDHYDFAKLGQQIARYRYGVLDAQGRDDILCNIGFTAELFSMADMEMINDRLRTTGRFFLTEGERQQVMNWLEDELGVCLQDGKE